MYSVESKERNRGQRGLVMYFLFGFHMRVYTDCIMEYGRALHVIIYGDGERVLAHRHCMYILRTYYYYYSPPEHPN